MDLLTPREFNVRFLLELQYKQFKTHTLIYNELTMQTHRMQ